MLGRKAIAALRDAGLRVDGGFEGATTVGPRGGTGFDGPVRAGLVEVRDADSGRWLFAVGLRETDFNVRAGISRPGETIVDSWPHDETGHVDGRCFMFCHGDEARTEAFVQALGREIERHRAPVPSDALVLAGALSEVLPDTDEDTLLVLARALGTGMDARRIAEMAARVEDVARAATALPTGP
jgi:hypothetical protein